MSNKTETISKDEFEKAMELRQKDYELQRMTIEHDKQRLAVLDKQCDAQNRATDSQERLTFWKEYVTSSRFMWTAASIIATCALFVGLAIRLATIV